MARAKIIKEEECLPHCIKEAELGKLDARIENNEKTGTEIKETLQRLVESNNKDRQDVNTRFTEMTAEVSKMSMALTQSSETSKELLQNQNQLLQQIHEMLMENKDLVNKQTAIDETIETHIKIADERYGKIKVTLETLGTRLQKLEQHRNTIMSIGALIISLITATGVIAQIFTAFK